MYCGSERERCKREGCESRSQVNILVDRVKISFLRTDEEVF